VWQVWYTDHNVIRLIAQVKLLPTPEQADALRRTLETAHAACNTISETAWNTQTFRQFPIHRLTYHHIKEAYNLTAQMTVRCIAKVADAYKVDRKVQRTFRPHGSIAYDDRILRWNIHTSSVNLWTVDGRLTIPFICGPRQRELLPTRRGETDLAYVNGQFYLLATCDVEEPMTEDVEGVLGVDLGVTNIATASDGTIHSGKAIKNVRHRHRRLRTKLQQKGTKGSRRRLKQLAGKERRFARHTNHVISKELVQRAQHTRRAIALENLKGIRSRVRVRRSQRAVLHSWAFHQLRSFINYKARLAGVPVHYIDPRNTSRTCPSCGHCEKANRKTQISFLCTSCGTAGLADVIAAENIRRVAVSLPYYSDPPAGGAPRVPACG
jgi:putative transposase